MTTKHFRIAGWLLAGALILAPAVAMRFTDAVRWSLTDFILFGGMVVAAAAAMDVFVSRAGAAPAGTGAALAVLTGFLLVWIDGAVDLLGSEGDRNAPSFVIVVAVLFVGALATRGRPRGMAAALAATAATQLALTATCVAGLFGPIAGMLPEKVAVLTAGFTALWLTSAGLFLLGAGLPDRSPSR